MIATLPLVAALLLATPQAKAEDKPASPAEIAAARTQADAIIARAEAGEFFENITTDASPTVRHKASGMTCAFSGDTHDYIRIFPTGPGGVPRGQDVGCGVRMMDSEITTYATRYPDGHSARDDLGASIAALTQRLPDARPHVGSIPVASRQGGPEVLAAAYDIKLNNEPKLTLILVAKADEWNFKLRATGQAGEPGESAMPLIAGMSFVLSLPGGRD
jgi:hypothetical protein